MLLISLASVGHRPVFDDLKAFKVVMAGGVGGGEVHLYQKVLSMTSRHLPPVPSAPS